MVGGGAGFNQLNGYFVPSNPSGENEINRKILMGLRNLRTFLESFVFAKMTRDTDTPQKISIGASVNMISEKGRQYAMYIHHSFPNTGKYIASYYEPNYGSYKPIVTMAGIPKGEYIVTCILTFRRLNNPKDYRNYNTKCRYYTNILLINKIYICTYKPSLFYE